MKTLLSFWMGLVVLAGAIVFAAPARAVVVSEKIEDTYHFTYYPDVEVYYVPAKHVYWWSENGTWRSAPAPPTGTELGTGVQIVVSDAEPWRHHEVIVKKYGGRTHKEIKEERKEEKREEHNEEKHD